MPIMPIIPIILIINFGKGCSTKSSFIKSAPDGANLKQIGFKIKRKSPFGREIEQITTKSNKKGFVQFV